MKHLYEFNQFNQRQLDFISSNTSAGTTGKVPQPTGSVTGMSLDNGYYKNLANAFDKFDLPFSKVKKATKPKPKSKLFKRKQNINSHTKRK